MEFINEVVAEEEILSNSHWALAYVYVYLYSFGVLNVWEFPVKKGH